MRFWTGRIGHLSRSVPRTSKADVPDNPASHPNAEDVFWTFEDIGWYFLGLCLLNIGLRVAAHFGILSRKDFVEPKPFAALFVLLLLTFSLFGLIKLRYGRAVWRALGWTLRWVFPESCGYGEPCLEPLTSYNDLGSVSRRILVPRISFSAGSTECWAHSLTSSDRAAVRRFSSTSFDDAMDLVLHNWCRLRLASLWFAYNSCQRSGTFYV